VITAHLSNKISVIVHILVMFPNHNHALFDSTNMMVWQQVALVGSSYNRVLASN